MVTLTDLWIPPSLSKAEGKEIEKLSLLGPFISLSVFSEDCVSKLIMLTEFKISFMYICMEISTCKVTIHFFVYCIVSLTKQTHYSTGMAGLKY